jgi:pimeloyl-ACP methyl ester carboxylesterase
MQSEDLDSGGSDVALSSVVLRTPGLAGTVVFSEPADGATRGPAIGTDELLEALDAVNAREAFTLELKELSSTSMGDSEGENRGEDSESRIEIDVPASADDEGQVLLYVAEDGVASWHFPEPPTESEEEPQPGQDVVTYRLPAELIPVPPEEGEQSRGIVSAIASKVLKVIVFPLLEPILDPLLKKAGNHFAAKFEEDKRLQRWRTFTPENYTVDHDAEIDDASWPDFTGKRTLLFIHGTGAMSHNAFDQLDREVLERLFTQYEGRVLALDHFTLSIDPAENVRRAVGALPHGVELDVDIVCHSRGGLVAREFAERSGKPSVNVHRVVMVGTPNAGTAIAGRDNLKSWLDMMTNVAQFVPDNPIVDILTVVLSVAKQLALKIYEGLEGLTSMDPQGDYLTSLNVDLALEGVDYFAIAADYEPLEGSALKRAHDLAMDLLFSNARNDLVVPTAGVGTIEGLGRFEPSSLLLDDTRGVSHFSFFGSPIVAAQLEEWLQPS